jgi:hypothetical protein
VAQSGGYRWDVNHENRNSITSMELERHHVVKFLHVKSHKLNEVATEPSKTYDRYACAPPSIKYSGVRKLFFLMGFSFSDMTQTRTSDSYGKFMDAGTIWHFPGNNWRAKPRYKL